MTLSLLFCRRQARHITAASYHLVHNKSKLASAIMLCSISTSKASVQLRLCPAHLLLSSHRLKCSTPPEHHRNISATTFSWGIVRHVPFQATSCPSASVPPLFCAHPTPAAIHSLRLRTSSPYTAPTRLSRNAAAQELATCYPAARALQKLLYTKPPCPSRASTTGLTPTSRRRRSDVKQFLSPPK